MTMQTNEFAGRGSTTYDGPQDEASYFRWLVGKYGMENVLKFPPATVVQFQDQPNIEYVVMGYCRTKAGIGLHLVDIADYNQGYERAVDCCRDYCPHEVEQLVVVRSLNSPERNQQMLDMIRSCG